MIAYILDAFNIIHKVEELKNSENPHHDFICFCKHHRLTGSNNNKVIIVFDGKFRLDAAVREKNWKVLFSDRRSADELIVERIGDICRSTEVVLVSDDRELQARAKAAGAKIKKVNEFIKKNNYPHGNKKSSVEPMKNISYAIQREITEEMRRIWLKDE